MIRKLRTDWLTKNSAAGSATAADSQAAWHDFHDKFLSCGGPPIPLVRKKIWVKRGVCFEVSAEWLAYDEE